MFDTLFKAQAEAEQLAHDVLASIEADRIASLEREERYRINTQQTLDLIAASVREIS